MAVDAVLRSVAVLGAVVEEDFFDLVTVGQGSGCHVHRQRLLGPRFRPEHQGLARVVQRPAHLVPRNKIPKKKKKKQKKKKQLS